MVLDPRNIMKGKRVIRTDNAREKRVELHMHTRFSTLDALTDPAAIVKRAAYWGMPAIAVTDHGVAQAFPDMWKAGKKEGVKIIYGMEAYYVNDMDGNSAVIGKSNLPLDTEFVAFDIETTGLNAQTERMTEIGAIRFSGSEILEEARIIAVADAYDAMTSRRSYRDILPQETVRAEIVKGRGTQFDPVFADIMLQIIDEDKEFKLREC
jgi:DNA polymerase-3 subunit alpha (Gram-positive type)